MTTGQIMMKLREIEQSLCSVIGRQQHDIAMLNNARATLGGLIAQMLADDKRALAARTMGELPYDGQRVK